MARPFPALSPAISRALLTQRRPVRLQKRAPRSRAFQSHCNRTVSYKSKWHVRWFEWPVLDSAVTTGPRNSLSYGRRKGSGPWPCFYDLNSSLIAPQPRQLTPLHSPATAALSLSRSLSLSLSPCLSFFMSTVWIFLSSQPNLSSPERYSGSLTSLETPPPPPIIRLNRFSEITTSSGRRVHPSCPETRRGGSKALGSERGRARVSAAPSLNPLPTQSGVRERPWAGTFFLGNTPPQRQHSTQPSAQGLSERRARCVCGFFLFYFFFQILGLILLDIFLRFFFMTKSVSPYLSVLK